MEFMNRFFRSIARNTRYWIYLFLATVFLIWIFQQVFFPVPPGENISALSHQKKGNKAFFEYLEEKKIKKEILYEPSYSWMKGIISETEEQTRKLKYVFVEKEKSFFWSSSEIEWFRRWLRAGNEMILFTLNPTVYWERLMLPVEFEDLEQKKKAKYHFPTGFKASLKEIVKDFLYQSIESPVQHMKEAKAYRCHDSLRKASYNLVSASSFSNALLESHIKATGWELKSRCKQGLDIFAQRWQYNEGKRGHITFVFSRDIINNEYIYLADNIVFLTDILRLSDQDTIIWDAFHQGVFKRPNLWYYLFYTVPGRIFLWLLSGLGLYFWFKNTKLRKYPLPKKGKEVVGASLVHFEALARKFNKDQIIQDTYKTLKSYLVKKGSGHLLPDDDIPPKQKLKEIDHYFK